MPRYERKASSTGIYHVMLRGINKQLIFEEREDYEKILAIIAEVKEISGFKLYAYCLMGNHLHLLMKVGIEPLGQIFKRIGARYVWWFNWKYGRSGHLFQDRYRSEPVENNEYFMMVLAYIYQNPVKAGICRRPEDYEWCSRQRLGDCAVVDEKELFDIVPLELIKEREAEEVTADLLEPRLGRGMALSDDEVIGQLKALGNVKDASGFQSLNREMQREIVLKLREKGASVRQIARTSGLGREIITWMCRDWRGI